MRRDTATTAGELERPEGKLTVAEVSFLRGLIAGEGCLSVRLNYRPRYIVGVQVEPVFSMEMVEDGEILETLCHKTGLGGVYDGSRKHPRHQDARQWRVSSQEDIEELIALLQRPEHNPVEFLLGLIAGEGSFKVSPRKDEGCSLGIFVRPSFSMRMVEDSEILETLCHKTGLGATFDVPAKNPRWRDAKDWQVQGQEDIEKLITMIEEQEDSLFWETDKGATFKRWTQAVEIKKQTDTKDPEGTKRLIHIAKELNPGDRGRSAEDWCAIVDDAVAVEEQKKMVEHHE